MILSTSKKIEIYELLLQLEKGEVPAEYVLMVILSYKEDTVYDLKSFPTVEVAKHKGENGLYLVEWEADSSLSLVSIGSLSNGERWIAPCNWTGTEVSDVVFRLHDLSRIKSFRLIASVNTI